MRESLEYYCERTGNWHILEEWDSVKNHPRTPASVSHGSRLKVWWVCAQGHHWQAAVYTRTGKHSGCPVCAGRQVLAGYNDLASRYPALAKEWHPTRNGSLSPEQVAPGSHLKVWWQCSKGHSWQSAIKARVAGTRCPVCAGKVVLAGCNDLASRYPHLAAEWHPSKNGPLTPQQVTSGSSRKVWWQCDQGHAWRASIASRVAGTGCPYCTGKRVIAGQNDLATLYPDLAREWHVSKNGPLTPDAVAASSNRKVWWTCSKGHDYQAVIASRTGRRNGCPYCSGRRVLPGFNDLATKYPAVARQWHPTLNAPLTPQQVTGGSRKKVWWQCDQGHVWQAVIYSRTGKGKAGCPICSGKERER